MNIKVEEAIKQMRQSAAEWEFENSASGDVISSVISDLADSVEKAVKESDEEAVFTAIDNFESGKRKGYEMAHTEMPFVMHDDLVADNKRMHQALLKIQSLNNAEPFGDILKEMRGQAEIGKLDADRADFEERVVKILKEYANRFEKSFGYAIGDLVIENVRMREALEWIRNKFWSGSDGGLHYQNCDEAREIINEALKEKHE